MADNICQALPGGGVDPQGEACQISINMSFKRISNLLSPNTAGTARRHAAQPGLHPQHARICHHAQSCTTLGSCVSVTRQRLEQQLLGTLPRGATRPSSAARPHLPSCPILHHPRFLSKCHSAKFGATAVCGALAQPTGLFRGAAASTIMPNNAQSSVLELLPPGDVCSNSCGAFRGRLNWAPSEGLNGGFTLGS